MEPSSNVAIARQRDKKQPSWWERMSAKLLGGAGRAARAEQLDRAHSLYNAAVSRARTPHFYAQWSVPDIENARLELIILHIVVLVRALRSHGSEGKQLAQVMIDLFTRDMDRSLREAGVGDLSVGKKVKQIAGCYHARAELFDPLIERGNADPIETALAIHVYEVDADDAETLEARKHFANYLLDQDKAMLAMPKEQLLSGDFAIMPVEPEG